jgi:TRAP-type C4-dicarboxylate transport system permease large subunit
MIVFAIFATNAGQRADVDDLFMAGIGPGIVLGVLLMGYCMVRGRTLPRQSFKLAELVRAFLDGIWALIFPFFILGGIYGGLFNATEASAISVLLAVVIELFIHRSLRARDLPRILGDTAVLMGSILIIICVAFAFAEWMAFREIPKQIVDWLRGFDLTSWDFVLILNVMLILVGCLMDIISAIILFVPLIMPIAGMLGFDPIHIGLIFIVNLEIGYLTPPLGLNLFVATTYFGKPLGLVLRSVLPYLGILMAGLMIVTYVPTISTGVVSLKNSKSFWSRMRVVTDAEGTIAFEVKPNPEFLQSFPDSKLSAMSEEAMELRDEGTGAPEKGATTGDTLQDLMESDEYQKLLDEAPDEPEEPEAEDDFDPDALPPLEDDEPGASAAPSGKDASGAPRPDAGGTPTP